jgi:hypothetical protein
MCLYSPCTDSLPLSLFPKQYGVTTFLQHILLVLVIIDNLEIKYMRGYV